MSWEERIETFKKEKEAYDGDLAEVVINTNQIESLIENLILTELRPDKANYEFMKDVLFNSAHLSLGAKLNIAKNVSERNSWNDIPWEKIYTLLRIRNSFAHTNPIYHESFTRKSLEDDGTHVKDILVVENKHGVIHKKGWKELMLKFRTVYKEVYEPLKQKSDEQMKVWGANVFSRIRKIEKED